MARFGFLPPYGNSTNSAWSKRRLTNARSETVRDKRSFRHLFASSRALVPCTGFYEWRTENGIKQPHFIGFEDDRIFAIAAVISRQDSTDDVDPGGFALLTTEPNETVAEIHNRMPVIVPPSAFDVWLDLRTPLDDLHPLLVPADFAKMCAHPVDRRVGNPRVNDSRLIEPINTAANSSPDDSSDSPPRAKEPARKPKPAQLSLF